MQPDFLDVTEPGVFSEFAGGFRPAWVMRMGDWRGAVGVFGSGEEL